jgi:hypothetical protein
MKKTALYLILSLIISPVFSQISTVTSSEISAFKKGKLYVVLNGGTSQTNVKYSLTVGDSVVSSDKKNVSESVDSDYNKAMRSAIKNFWKFTKEYEFITEQEFETKKMENNTYFLLPVKIKTTDKEPILLNYLMIVKGGPKSKKVEKMPVMAGIPLSYFSVSDQYYNYKLGALVQFLQTHMEFIFLSGPQEEKKVLAHYNGKSKEIKHGTLYVQFEDLTEKVFDLDAISKFYKGEVKIVDQGEIAKAIKKQDPNVLILHKVSPERTSTSGICKKYIISAKGGELLYIDEHSISKSNPEGLLDKDFKAFSK